MKNIKTTTLVLLITTSIGLGLNSCKKDNTSTVAAPVTEADAAELTTQAIAPSSGGLVLQVNNSVSIYKTATLSCGVKKDSTITRTSANGVTPSYNYSLSWDYTLACLGIVPNELTFNFTGSSKYDGVRMSSDDKSTGGFVLGGLQPSASAYTLNTTYNRVGTQTSKIVRKYNFSSNLTIQSSNIIIDKSTQKIVSGTATVVVSGTSSSGKQFAFNGNITFLGGEKATLVLNSGAGYNIQW